MKKINIDNLISEMTLEEKASLCSAADAWQYQRKSKGLICRQ